MTAATSIAASLDNPLYYLENGRTLVRWVRDQHGDLLLPAEKQRLAAFLQLGSSAQALLLRLIMRTHDQFRVDALHYPELAQPLSVALDELLAGQWLSWDPPLPITALARLLRRHEWQQMLQAQTAPDPLPAGTRKAEMVAALTAAAGDAELPISRWWPDGKVAVVAVTEGALFQRLRLMFFGNLHQDWSQFVITALGHQRYEPVALSSASRAFQSRDEVDLYLALHQCRQALEEADPDLHALWQQIPAAGESNLWLANRRARLLHALGHQAERNGDVELALQAYSEAWLPESRVRYFRVRERHHLPHSIWPEALAAESEAGSMEERVSLQRILKRLAPKVGGTAPATRTLRVTTEHLTLEAPPAKSIELATAEALSRRNQPCHYVENTLFNGLLGLLCWPALFAPVPGAFFHPFQAGPADLFREDFALQRQEQLDACLNKLDNGDYPQAMRATWHSRHGIACSLINWSCLTQAVLEQALACIPAADLKTVFRHLLADLRRHRRGLPDLVQFDTARGSYELIEVKGPGDRLQDHQRLWLEFFAEHGIRARVCHVDWEAGQ